MINKNDCFLNDLLKNDKTITVNPISKPTELEQSIFILNILKMFNSYRGKNINNITDMQKTFKTDLCKLSDGDKNVFKSIVYIAAIDTGSTISSATHTIITSLLTNTIFNKIKDNQEITLNDFFAN